MLSKNEFVISFVATPCEITDLMIELISKSKNSKVLDTGCGEGAFLQSLEKYGYNNVSGIELNKKMANFCSSKYISCKIFNDDYLVWNTEEKFDVIIGNPPYLHFNSLPQDAQNIVSKITGSKETDIYYAFIMKSIDLLKENGELIYIVPYGFFYATHAKAIREKIIRNGYLDLVIDLDENKLFKGENPETIIFKFIKSKVEDSKKTKTFCIKSKKAKPLEIKKKALQSLKELKENDLFIFHKKIFSRNSRNVWSSLASVEIPHYKLLEEISFVGVGMVSGFDKSFALSDTNESSFSEKESKILLPFMKAKHCRGYWTEGKTNYIFFDDLIKTEIQLKKEYPSIYKRFIRNKENMTSRYLPNGKKWYNWQALRNFNDHKRYLSKIKIFVPTLDRSKENRFSLTKDELYPAGDVLTIVPNKIDPHFLLGYLNSDFFRKYYLAEGARRGHRIAFTQRILANAKIPIFSNEIVNEISQITKIIIKNKDKKDRDKIELIIKEAFEKDLFDKEKGLLKYFNKQ